MWWGNTGPGTFACVHPPRRWEECSAAGMFDQG